MKKLILFTFVLFSFNSFYSQNSIEQIDKFINSSYTLGVFINNNMQENEVETFKHELSLIKNNDELNIFAIKHFGSLNAQAFQNTINSFIEDYQNFSKLNLNKDEYKSILNQNKEVEMVYCRDLAGYQKCMSPIDEEFNEETIDFLIEFGGAVGTVVVTEGFGFYVGVAVGLNAIRGQVKAKNNFELGRKNCMDLYCK